jgi:hypothetical protein
MDFCEYKHKCSGSVKGGENSGYQSVHQFLTKDSSAWTRIEVHSTEN